MINAESKTICYTCEENGYTFEERYDVNLDFNIANYQTTHKNFFQDCVNNDDCQAFVHDATLSNNCYLLNYIVTITTVTNEPPKYNIII